MSLITRQGRALLAVAVVVGAFLLFGCGGITPGTTPGTTPGGSDSYESVVLGGKTWMKKNLDVQTADSWCYGNSADSCAKYGRLYTWQAAKSACQSIGWRLPDTADWRRLVEVAGGIDTGGSKLKSSSGWYNNGNGADTYGFSALPGGLRNSSGRFDNAGHRGNWWTATERGSNGAYNWNMFYSVEHVDEGAYYEGDALSARCVKDD